VSQEDFEEQLGRVFSTRRRELTLSQEYLATILRRDQTYVSKVETGKRSSTLFEFMRWAKALNLEKAEIVKILESLEEHVE
jgi:transcriptional regulator with XRE-family HTH domain